MNRRFARERWGFALYRNALLSERRTNLSYELASARFEELVLQERDSRDSNVQLLIRRQGHGRYEAAVQAVGRKLLIWDADFRCAPCRAYRTRRCHDYSTRSLDYFF